MTNRPSGIIEFPDGSSVHCEYIRALVVTELGVSVHFGEGSGTFLATEGLEAAQELTADLSARWRAALGERAEPEQPVGNADDLWKSVPEGTDIDDMFGPDPEPEQPAVAEFKEGDRVILRGALPDEPLGTVRAVSGVDRLAWVTWDGALMVLRATGHMFGDLEQS